MANFYFDITGSDLTVLRDDTVILRGRITPNKRGGVPLILPESNGHPTTIPPETL